MRPKVYLAGSMAGRITKDVILERKRASQLCRKKGLQPLDPGFNQIRWWTKYRISDAVGKKKMAVIVDRDLKMVRRADALVVLTGDKNSDGTSYEKAYAQFIGLPVVLVAPDRCAGKLMSFSNVLFRCEPTLERALNFIKRSLKAA